MAITPWTRTLILTFSLGLLLAAPSAFTATSHAADEAPNLAGTWIWSWKDPEGGTHRHVLEVEGIGGKLAAREQFDNLAPVPALDLQLMGKTVRFTVVRGERRADYQGVMADRDTINGKVKVTSEGQTTEDLWEATRKQATK
jgi:hypothetical protein